MRRKLTILLSFAIAVVLAVAHTGSVVADPVTPGNLVIYRVGTGGAALDGTATAVFLDEYTTSGGLVQSIPISTTGTTAMTASGSSSTEGIISRSQDGNSLVFTGYRKAAGGTAPSSDSGATTPRVIGTLTLTGTPSTAIDITDFSAGSAGTIPSAVTVSGSNYYVGASGSVGYVASPGAGSTRTVIDARNSRQVNLGSNTLYASNGSTAITGKVQTYGTLPTGATSPTPIVVH